MNKPEKTYYQTELFGQIFALNNALQLYLDDFLKEEGLTVKQMYTMLAIDHFKQESPTLKDLAMLLKSSHQNVKQLVNKLRQNDYVLVEKDSLDKRALRISLTKKAKTYFKEYESLHSNIIKDLFKGITQRDLQVMLEGMMTLMKNIEDSEDTV